ncbi:amino acid kinase family protein [Streptomyces flavofungini]|uniref:amino acid kinase family protein n=1 Tax=Streptomyces flavofungini TaxID=68200 RepID=UPI0034DE1662
MRARARSDAAGRDTAEVLIAALPRLRELHGTTVVVVAGHHVLADEKLRDAFCADVGFLRYSGVRTVVVHDGGPHLPAGTADDPVALRGHVAGHVQRGLVGALNAHTRLAVGITGEDGRTLVTGAGANVLVDPGVVRMFLDSGRIPVVSSIAYGKDGGVRYLGATRAAKALASALDATLVLPAGDAVPEAVLVDMSVPHAVLRHLHHLDDG